MRDPAALRSARADRARRRLNAPVRRSKTQDDDVGPLLGCVALGDRQAFAALYRATAPHLFGLILRIHPDWAPMPRTVSLGKL